MVFLFFTSLPNFFGSFHLPQRCNFKQIFGAQIFLCADFSCADFRAQTFAQIFHGFFFDLLVLRKGVKESRKSEHKISKITLRVPRAFPGWVPYSMSALLSLEQTAGHTTAARPKHSRRACERTSWRLGAHQLACVCSKT